MARRSLARNGAWGMGVGLLVALTLATAHAQTLWTGATNNFNLNTNWQANTLPSGSVVGQFGAGGNTAPILNNSISVLGLEFVSGAATRTFAASGTRALTIGASGIVNDAGATNTQTFGGAGNLQIALGANAAFTNNDNTGALVFNSSLNQFTLSTFTLTLNGSSTNTANSISKAILGTGGITKSGSGTWVLTGTNQYTGPTTISGGVLEINNVANYNQNSALGKTTTAAGLVLDGGTLRFNSAAADSTNRLFTLTANGGTIDSSGGGGLNMSGTGNLTVSGSGNRTLTLTGDSAAASTLAANIVNPGTGTTALTKSGTGLWTLSGTNTYTGATTINAGTLKYGVAGALPSTTAVTMNGGTLDLNTFSVQIGSLSGTAGTIDSTGAGTKTFTVGDANNTSFSGTIQNTAGTIALTKVGNGTLTLGGTNTYSGGTNINAGILALGSSGAIGTTGTIAFGGGTLQYSASNTTDYSSRFSNAASQSYKVDTNGQNVTLASNLTSSGGSMTKSGNGILTLSGANTYTGGTNLNGGTLALGSSGAIGTTGTISFGGGTLRYSASNTTDYSSRFSNLANQSYSIDTNSQNVSFGTGLSSSGGTFAKTGAGTLTLNATNSYTGVTTINGGTLKFGTNNALPTATALTLSSATLDLNNFNATLGSLAGSGTVDLTTAAASKTLTVGDATNTTFSGVIQNTGSTLALTKNGSGTLTLSGANTYSGATTINAGTLKYGATNTLPTGTAVTMNGGTLDLDTYNAQIGSLSGTTGTVDSTGSGAKTFTVGNSSSTSFSGTIQNTAGSLALTKTGSSTLTLGGTNTYTGGTNINAGTLALGSAGAIGSSGTVSFGGGTLQYSATNTTDYSARFSSAASQSYKLDTNGQNVTLGTGFGGTGGTLTKTGSGTLTLGAANAYTGATTINGGTLAIGADNRLGTAPGAATPGSLTLGGGTLQATSSFTLNSNRGVALTAATTSNITANNSQTLTYGGAIAGTGNITFGTAATGTGTVALSGNSGFTGSVAVNAGTLRLLSDTALGNGTAGTTVASGATVELNGQLAPFNGTLTLAGTGASGAGGAIVGNTSDSRWDNNIVLSGSATAYNNYSAGYLALGANSNPNTRTVDANTLALGANTLTLSGGGTVHLNSQITGTGGVTVNMNGASDIVQMNANQNTYTGETWIKQGTLVPRTTENTVPGDVGTPNLFGINGAIRIGDGSGAADSAVLKINNEGSRTTELINYNSAVTIETDGLFSVGSVQSVGALTLNGGRINLFDDAAGLYLNGSVSVANGATASIDGTGRTLSLTVHRQVGDLSPNADRIFDTIGTGSLTINARIVNGSITKNGTGTLTLTGNNTGGYEGTTTINSGIVAITNSNALGQGGTDASATIVSNTSPGTLQISNNVNVTNEKLTLNGTGYGGNGALRSTSGTNIWGGVVTLGSNSRVQVDGGSLTLSGNINSAANGTLTVAGAGDTTISGIIGTGSGGLTKTDAGTLYLSGDNTYTGATSIGTGGTVQISHASALGGTGGGTTVASGATLAVAGGITTNAEPLTISGTGVGSDGALRNVSGNNTFAGAVTLGADSLITANTGTTFGVGSVATAGNQVTFGSGTRQGDINSGAVTGSGALVKTGSGTLTIAGTTTSVGTVAMNGGALNFNSTTSTTTGTVNLNAGTLTFNSPTTTTGVVNVNAGTLNFNGTTGTTGAVHMTGGDINVGGALTLSTGNFDSSVGTTLTIATGGTVNAAITAPTTFGGEMAGGGTFVKTGAGALTLNNGFTATNLNLSLSSGTLSITGDAFAVGTLTLSGGTLSLSNAQFTATTIHITGNTILDFNNSAGTTLSSATLLIDNGVTVTINNWVTNANATLATIWYAQNNINGTTQPGGNYLGSNLNEVSFTSYPGYAATWIGSSSPTGFVNEIRPTPEPATYGLMFFSGLLGLLAGRRFLRRDRTGKKQA